MRFTVLTLLLLGCDASSAMRPPAQVPMPVPPREETAAAPDAGPPPMQLPDPERYAIWGIDLSHHQEAIDWTRVAQQPKVKFAFIKATQGARWTDKRFRRNWKAARAAGLRVGAYHYYSFCSDPEPQAAHFLEVVPRAKDALPAVLDVEHLYNCAPDPDPEKVRAQLRTWLQTVERATHRKPMIYATADVLADYFVGTDLDYPLWVRCTPEDPEPVLELSWRFLQYDDQHELPGITGAVDHDVFVGDDASLAELARAAEPHRARADAR